MSRSTFSLFRSQGLLCVMLFLLALPAFAQTKKPADMTPKEKLQAYAELDDQLHPLFAARKYAEAEKLCRKLIALLPDRFEAYYNLACAQAQLGKKNDALATLAAAVEKGFSDPEHMKRDPDLEAIREDKRFEPLVEKASTNADAGLAFPYDAPRDVPGVKTVEHIVPGGLPYRLRMNPKASADNPDRLIVWLHPSGGYANVFVEPLAPRFIKHGYALLVLTRKNPAGWTGEDLTRLDATLRHVGTIEGIDASRPLLMGFSAGGQAALYLWARNPAAWEGLILDAAYPIDTEALAEGRAAPMNIPDDPAIKKTPILAFIGTRDSGARLWQAVKDDWTEAGVPLTIHEVPGKGHEWLFDAPRLKLLDVRLGSLHHPAPHLPPELILH